MKNVQGAALTVCLSLLMTALVRHAAPKGLSEQLMRTVCGIFVLAVLLHAVHGVCLHLPVLSFAEVLPDDNLQETVFRQRMGETERAAHDAVAGLLDAAAVPYRSVHIFMDNGRDGSIELTRIRVIVPTAPAQLRARSLLTELFENIIIEVKIE